MEENARELTEQEKRRQASERMVTRLLGAEYAPLLVKSVIEESRALSKVYDALDYDEREKLTHYLMGAYHVYHVMSVALIGALDQKED